MAFRAVTVLCDHDLYLVPKLFTTLRAKKPIPIKRLLSTSSFPPPPGNYQSVFWVFYINELVQCVTFYVWLLAD